MDSSSSPAHVTAALAPNSPDSATAAARTIKNAIVGNPTNKRIYLQHDVVPRLIACTVHVDEHPLLADHAVATLGSLAPFIPPPVIPDVVHAVLKCLFSRHVRPLLAATRALKLLVCAPQADLDLISPLIALPDVATRFVPLLQSDDEGIAEVCAVIISKTAKSPFLSSVYSAAATVPALVQLLCRTLHERCVEACTNALFALAHHSAQVSYDLAVSHNIISTILPFTRTPVHSLRLSACRLLTSLHTSDLLPSPLHGPVATAIVNLFTVKRPSFVTIAVNTLTQLVQNSSNLQRVATEADAVSKLANMIFAFQPACAKPATSKPRSNNRSPSSTLLASRDYNARRLANRDDDGDTYMEEASPEFRSGMLTALAALSDKFDPARDAIIAHGILPIIVEGLSESHPSIVLACVQCIRSLSRSVKILRRDVAKDKIGEQLLSLLESPHKGIQRCASSTLCNLVLEFSPVRSVVIKKGGTDVIINLLQSEDQEIRKNCLWALKNMLFKADLETKNAVMSRLGYDCLEALFDDDQPDIRELAMTVVRNLACSPSADKQTEQLDALFAATGERIITLLSDALRVDAPNTGIAVQALYVVCNIASGTEQHKAYLLKSEIPSRILHWSRHEDDRARIAAVWCAINLSWKEPAPSRRCHSPSIRRPLRAAGRGSSSVTLDLLRRQRLPLPASAQGRRILERYGAADRGEGDEEGLHVDLDEMEDADMAASDGNHSDVCSDFEAGERRMELTVSEPREAGHDVGLSSESVVAQEGGNGNGEVRQREDEGTLMNGNENESSPSDGGGEQEANKDVGHAWRIELLRQLGFEGRLRSLINDPHIEVQGRARAALELFECEDVPPLEYDPVALHNSNAGMRSPRFAQIVGTAGTSLYRAPSVDLSNNSR